VTYSEGWTENELDLLGATRELLISVRKPDGTWRRAVPVWVVCVRTSVYVRTWYRRNTGWFGDAVRTGHARVSVPGLSTDVTVTDIVAAEADPGLRADVDESYRTKYGRYGDAASTTLRLNPAERQQVPLIPE